MPRRITMPGRVVVAAGATVAIVFGGGVAYAAVTAKQNATCTASPTITKGANTSSFDVHCSYPNPTASTVTVTAPPSTVTVTAPPTSSTTSPTSTTSTTTPPTSTTTTTAPPPTGFPDASNTGVPAGTTLRTVRVGDTGPGWSVENAGGYPVFYVRTAGAVIDALDIQMPVKVIANNVTIKRSKITAGGYYTVNVSDPPTYYSGLTLTDDEIDGGSNLNDEPGIAIMAAANATYTRLNIHGFGSSGPRMASGATLQDSWLHDFICKSPWHSAGSSANDGGSNISYLHNNIDINTTSQGCATASIEIAPDFGTYDGVKIIGNLVNGGAYCIYAGQQVPGGATGKNIRVENNVVGRKYRAECGEYGPFVWLAPGVNGNTFSGNTWGGGAAATSSHQTGDPVN